MVAARPWRDNLLSSDLRALAAAVSIVGTGAGAGGGGGGGGGLGESNKKPIDYPKML